MPRVRDARRFVLGGRAKVRHEAARLHHARPNRGAVANPFCFAVDAEIVQNDGLGVREVDVGQVFQDASVIHGGMAICDLTDRQSDSELLVLAVQ
jgi:hypothetical protein